MPAAATTPLVSILLPTHNRADVLGYAIQSVLSQSIGDFELLIVGDGCTDTTRDVVRYFDDPRIKWFDLPKTPLSGYANRNIALRQAVGEVVAYAQHDDVWFPDHLQLLLDALARAGAEWAYSRPLWIGPDGVVCPSPVNLTLSDEFDHFLNIENCIPSSCIMHLRTALERVGYWPEDQVHIADWVCWQRMIRTAANPTVGYCRVPTCLHFRAIWRDFDSHPELAWRPLAQEPWWPPVLVYPPAGEPEQAILWQAMAGGRDWTNRVREAIESVVDRLAWRAIRDLLPEIECAHAGRAAAEADACHARAERDAISANIAELEAQRDAASAQADRDREALEMMLASTSWRATAPVRGIVNALKQIASRSARGRAGRDA